VHCVEKNNSAIVIDVLFCPRLSTITLISYNSDNNKIMIESIFDLNLNKYMMNTLQIVLSMVYVCILIA